MSHKEDYPTLKGSPDGLRRLVHDYLEELEIAGRAGLTAKRYGAYLTMFIDWLAAAMPGPVSRSAPRRATSTRPRCATSSATAGAPASSRRPIPTGRSSSRR